MASEQGNHISLPDINFNNPLTRRRAVGAGALTAVSLLTGCRRGGTDSEPTAAPEPILAEYLGENEIHEEFPGAPKVTDWSITMDVNAIAAENKGRWEAVLPDGNVVGSIHILGETDNLHFVSGSVEREEIGDTGLFTEYSIHIDKPDTTGKVSLRFFADDATDPTHILEIPLAVSVYSESETGPYIVSKSELTTHAVETLYPELDQINRFGLKKNRALHIPPIKDQTSTDLPEMGVDEVGDIRIDRLELYDDFALEDFREGYSEHLWECILSDYEVVGEYGSVRDAIIQFNSVAFRLSRNLNGNVVATGIGSNVLTIRDYFFNLENYPTIQRGSKREGEKTSSHDSYENLNVLYKVISDPEYLKIFKDRYSKLDFPESGTSIAEHYMPNQATTVRLLLRAYYDVIDAINKNSEGTPQLSEEAQELFDYLGIYNIDFSQYPPDHHVWGRT